MHRRWLTGAAVLALALSDACGSDGTPVQTTPAPSSTFVPTIVPTIAPSTSAPASTVAAPPTSSPGPPLPGRLEVARGDAFVVDVGETVVVRGEDLTLTYERVVSDNRCPPDVQCIVAGNGRILVTLSKGGGSRGEVELNTLEGPTSGPFLEYTVELLDLDFGPAPAAHLRIT